VDAVTRAGRHQVASTEPLGGFFWCLVCLAPADLEDPGCAYPRCIRCGERKIEWQHEIVAPSKTPPPPLTIVPEDAHPIFTHRRLPSAERPTLSVMTYRGYWLCLACHEPTKRDDQGCCVLCGSSQVEWQPPAIQEDSP
jgi:hypothetical protein